MSEKIKSEVISRRRALSLLGLAAALSFTVPPTVLMVSDAEAQPAPAPADEKTGTERRHERREHRRERRHERRKHRRERHEERSTGTEEKK
jgi:hypothetical protein